jgi:pimeloyl-ACP methyl ester carboxylesterase
MRIASVLCSVLLLVPGCSLAQHHGEEIVFRSGPFKIVGEIRMPEGSGSHPAVVFVHGDGPNNRTSGVTYPPIMQRMLRAGYATLAWDKPGTGESTGQIDRSRLGEQRAWIVLDALAYLKGRSDIDHGRIGLWGISQAGYVMPRVLEQSEEIAFMIAISCAGGPGVEQGIYLLAAQMICAGHPAEDAQQLEQQIRAFTMAETYEQYVLHKAPLVETAAFKNLAKFGQRVEITPEDDWHPADPKREYYAFDPMTVIEKTTIPILAVFGERDTQVDPVQGAEAYRSALGKAGNPHSRVELIPDTDHNILLSETGCIAERNRRSAAGWSNYPPAYLDLIEEWLMGLKSQSPTASQQTEPLPH